MEFRKLISFGKSSFVVSLPKAWLEKNNLRKGSLVKVDQGDASLILSAKVGEEDEVIKKTNLETKGLDTFILRYLAAIYKAGYDEVKITYDDPEVTADVPQFMNEVLLGYEILDQGDRFLTIKNISKGLDAEFENILRKIFIVTVSIARNTLEFVEKQDLSRLKEIRRLEQTNNKFCNFCERYLNKRRNGERDHFLYCIVWELEKVADEFKYLALYLSENQADNPKFKLSKDAMELFAKVSEMFVMLYEVFYKFDKSKIEKISNTRKEIIKKSHELFNKKNEDARVLHYLVNITQLSFNMLGSYLGRVV